MRILQCPRCHRVAPVQSLECWACGAMLGYHPGHMEMVEVSEAGSSVDEPGWTACSNRGWECNWLLPSDAEAARCFSCRLNRNRPASDDTLGLESLADASKAKRRLLIQLAELGLPIEPFHRTEGGLAFDLLSSRSGTGPVTIGHANGVVTIDLAETLDDYRERLRIQLGEPYRTMLGHFRHEVGHYFQSILVVEGPRLDECRALFGDERASYSDAIDRHYRIGAPDGWTETHISEYATMHPWEDFAETFAHYLHITDTLTTAATAGMRLDADRTGGLLETDLVLRPSYTDVDIADLLADWRWLSMLSNAINNAMGKADLYPFGIVDAVAEKMGFVHRVVTETGHATPRPILV